MFKMKKFNMKKLFAVSLFLFVLSCGMVAISAEDANVSTQSVQNGGLTLSGLQFKIPQGYSPVESDQDHSHPGDAEHMDGTAVDSEVSADYRNANGQKLDIHVGSRSNSKIDTLNLPYHLDGIIIDEFNNIIADKFGMTPYYETDYFYD